MKKKRGLSRRQFLGRTAAVALAAGSAPAISVMSAQGPGSPGSTLPPDQTLVLTNGRIHTMNAANTVVDTVSIRNGRIVSVGGRAPAAGPNIRVVDLKGRTAVPGLIEGHDHVVSLANRPGYHTVLENTSSIREIQEVLAARRKDVPAGQWITSMGGWHPNQWAEHRHPTRQELDAAVPDRPVLLYERFTGPCVTNSLGKAFFDAADAAAPVHPNITKVNVSDTGAIAAAGFAGGGPSASALFLLRRLQTFDDKKRSTIDAMNYSASLGLTAHLDEVLFPTPGPLHPSQILSNLDQYRMYDSWLALHKEGKTTVRLQMNFLQNQNDPALPELKERLRNQFQFFGDDMMMTGSIGEWAAPINSGAVWRTAQDLVGKARWRNENAVANLAELEQVVNEYEIVNGKYGIKDLRWVVHHVPFVTTDLLNRLKALGCGVVMRGFTWITGTPTANGAPFRMILDNGIQAGLEGDGVHISTLNPWHHMHYAVTGVNALGQLINGGQQITRQEALRLFTRGNSWFLKMEDDIGSIERGKLADLVVLNSDYFSVPEADIKKVRAVLTIVNGRTVHDSGVLKT
jgi:hypothetical protein